jgi:hypothetical protein
LDGKIIYCSGVVAKQYPAGKGVNMEAVDIVEIR